MKDELDDQLTAMLRHHIDNHEEAFPGADALDAKSNAAVDSASLPSAGSVSVTIGEPENLTRVPRERGPDAHEMASGPDTFATPVSRPGSIPAQMGQAITGAAKPKSTPAVNLAAPMGAHDEELAGLQRDAKATRSMSRLGQAVTDFTERPTNLLDYAQRLGGGGVSAAPKSKMWQENAAEGDRAIADLGQRREADAAMAKSRTLGEMAADDNDPNGQTAQTYRSVLVKFAPDLSEQLKGASPKQMRAIAPWLEKFATENNDLIQASAKAEADAKTKAAAKEQHDADQKVAGDRFDRTDERQREANAATLALARSNQGIRVGEIEKKAADDVKDDVKDLAKALPADLADFDQKAADIQAMIDGSPGDIPGVGGWDARKPAFMRSKKDSEMQKKAGQMQAAYQKLVTGTGGGEKELANLERIGLMLTNEDSFVEGFKALQEAYHAKVKQVRSGFASPVLQQYDKNASREGLGGKPAPKLMKLQSGEIVEVE